MWTHHRRRRWTFWGQEPNWDRGGAADTARFRPWPKLPVVPAGSGSSRIQCLFSAGCVWAGRDVMSCRDRWIVVVLSLVRRRRHIPPDIAEPWQ